MQSSVSMAADAAELPLAPPPTSVASTILKASDENAATDCSAVPAHYDGLHKSLNKSTESDACSSDYSSSVPSVESVRDRAHLRLDFNSMQPRSNKRGNDGDAKGGASVVANCSVVSTSADSTYSPPTTCPTGSNAVAFLADTLVKQLTPDQVQQIQQSWKSALLNGVQLNSPLQTSQSLLSQLQQQASVINNNIGNNNNTDDTPTPHTLYYPKNVTTPQEAFAEGFQKVLARVHRKHQFEPQPQPSCTPNSVKHILSLLTPLVSQKPFQPNSQPPDIISLFRQNLPSATQTSPTVPFFNAPSLPPTSNVSGKASADASFLSSLGAASSSANNLLTSASQTYTDSASVDYAAGKRKADQLSNALAYQQLLLSPTTAAAVFSGASSDPSATTTDSVTGNSAANAAVAVVAAVAAAVNANSPNGEPQGKSPRIATDSGTPLGDKSPSKFAVNLFNGLNGLKLDPNNPSYMEFLHHHQQQSQQQQINSTNFLPSFASNPVGHQMQLGFSPGSAFLPAQSQNDPQLLLATSQQQHLHSGHQRTVVQPPQCLPLAQQQQQQHRHMSVKQEADIIHDSGQMSMQSTSVGSTTLTQLESKQTEMKRKMPMHNDRANFSDCSEASMDYSNQNNPFEQDQEQKKLERKRARNRMAASKCRQRKLARINELEDQVRQYQTEGIMLQSEIQLLKRQVDELNEAMNRHRMAGCAINTPFKLSNI